MLSGLLRSDVAVEVNIKIINAFVRMRHIIKDNLLEQQNINNIVLEDEIVKDSLLNKIKKDLSDLQCD
jgi:hypothetical protein